MLLTAFQLVTAPTRLSYDFIVKISPQIGRTWTVILTMILIPVNFLIYCLQFLILIFVAITFGLIQEFEPLTKNIIEISNYCLENQKFIACDFLIKENNQQHSSQE